MVIGDSPAVGRTICSIERGPLKQARSLPMSGSPRFHLRLARPEQTFASLQHPLLTCHMNPGKRERAQRKVSPETRGSRRGRWPLHFSLRGFASIDRGCSVVVYVVITTSNLELLGGRLYILQASRSPVSDTRPIGE